MIATIIVVSKGLLAPLFVRDCLAMARSESNDDEGDDEGDVAPAASAV